MPWFEKGAQPTGWHIPACETHGAELVAKGFRREQTSAVLERPCPFCAGTLTLERADCSWCALGVDPCPTHGKK